MKRLALTSLVLVCTILLLAATATAKDEKDLAHETTYTKKIIVPGDQAWVNTGINLGPGDSVTIAAEGTVYFSNTESISKVSPQGYDRKFFEIDFILEDAAYCYDPDTKLNHAALIGEIGGEIFYVGPKKVVAKKQGILSLGINDCSFTGTERFDNSGQFNVKIIVHVNKNPIQP